MDKLIALLIPALIAVESGGDWSAVGDKGKSLGGLQIQRACWQDGVEALGVEWPYKTGAHDPERATAVAAAYLTRYGRSYKKRTGKKATLEVLARIWVAGPRGYEKKASLPYWKKVQAAIAVDKND